VIPPIARFFRFGNFCIFLRLRHVGSAASIPDFMQRKAAEKNDQETQ
jgi:hypothetical protein